jgi:5'-methylthioadenosine phosphorylase
VDLILASYAVGSLNDTLPPGSIIAVDQFIDLTVDREGTFFDGEEFGLSHATDMTQPFCQTLREKAIKLGPKHGLQIKDGATYVAMRGPRFETAAESEMAKRLGGDVVGMTAVPEAPLARELGLHYAGFAIVTNYAPGIKGQPKVEYNLLDNYREPMLSLFLDVIQADFEEKCQCSAALNLRIPPVVWNLRRQA